MSPFFFDRKAVANLSPSVSLATDGRCSQVQERETDLKHIRIVTAPKVRVSHDERVDIENFEDPGERGCSGVSLSIRSFLEGPLDLRVPNPMSLDIRQELAVALPHVQT